MIWDELRGVEKLVRDYVPRIECEVILEAIARGRELERVAMYARALVSASLQSRGTDTNEEMAICLAALKAHGVPDRILAALLPGRLTDTWVRLVVMQQAPWQEVEKIVAEAREQVMAELEKGEKEDGV